MRILFTSDWQVDYSNLDMCELALKEILQIQSENNFDAIALVGDLKHQYNPVDLRVTNFWMKAAGKLRKVFDDVFALLGNHDRVGMHVDVQNWFPVLREAGIQAYDDFDYYERHGRKELAFAPYRANSIVLKRRLHDLAAAANSDRTVLLYHSELRSAQFNVLSKSESGEILVADLCPERYLFCIGGHIHLQQNVARNVWYAGSPFATDWGEANQKKGYLAVDTKQKTIERIYSKIPGWYDPDWPGFERAKPKTWKNSNVRIKVRCERIADVRTTLDSAREKAAGKYPGANLTIVPDFVEADRAETAIKNSYPDEKKIRLYVQETLPDELKNRKDETEHYLIDQLSRAGGLQRETGELEFTRIAARNFLSYETLDIKFKEGLSVVIGQNLDWKNRSNGSGKTSFLQPIAVAHSGQTFKEQKHDGWMRRGIDKKDDSWVKVWFRDSRARECSIKRGRQPRELKFKVAGEVVENGNRPEGTQRLIEQVTGYTWATLSNAIYVDQTKSHLMLTGTEAERKGFLARLQNLERFERAEKQVKLEKTELEDKIITVSNELRVATTEVDGVISSISDTRKILAGTGPIKEVIKRALDQYLLAKQNVGDWYRRAKRKESKLTEELYLQAETLQKYSKMQGTVEERLRELEKRKSKYNKLQGTCPVCEQEISKKHIEHMLPEVKEAVRHLKAELEGYEDIITKLRKKCRELEADVYKYQRNLPLEDAAWEAKEKYIKLKAKRKQARKAEKLIDELRARRERLWTRVAKYEQKLQKYNSRMAMRKYALTVFQRSGLPAYLNAQICPELNRAAAEYAELFSEREIQVRFAVDEEGRLDVKVINAHGGEGVEDQSEGEMKIASLITSFAVRSAAPKTNVLILDEPGDGLDATSARVFAKGLRSVLGRFKTVILTTHNPAILSELSDANLIQVQKKNNVSEVVA